MAGSKLTFTGARMSSNDCLNEIAFGSGGGGGGGGGAITVADGADVTLGSLADAASSAGGAGTVAAKLRKISADIASLVTANHTDLTAPTPAGTNLIGKTGIDQTTPGTTNGVIINSLTTSVYVSTALEASHVIKASAGSLVYLGVHNTSASVLTIMLINATSLPGNGAVTLLYPPIQIPATGDISLALPIPLVASTGIVVAGSTSDGFSLTIATSVLAIYAQYR